MRIKVLPLEYWMLWDDALEDCLESGRYPAALPLFYRPGIYLEGTACWFELADGNAFCYPRETFMHTLARLEAERLNARQVAALADIVAQRLATKQQRELLQMCRHVADLRETSRNAGRWRCQA